MKQFFNTLFFIIIFQTLQAHPLNTSYIDINLNKLHPILKLRFYTSNLNKLLMINEDLTPTIVNKRKREILKYIQNSILIKNSNKLCKLEPRRFFIENEVALQTEFQIKCKEPLENFFMQYRLFFEFDKTQEGVMQLITPNNSEKMFIFSPHQKSYNLAISNNLKEHNFQNFIIEGVWHIWEGIDHILFLLMLLLPSVQIKNSFKEVLIEVLKVVTAFTISHSITLSLSMFNILNPPEQIIETLIAISVLLTALNNIFPTISYKKEWLLAFGFGFIHGFGFANAMHEMNLNILHFASAVFGFNIGVEIGQIVIVLILLPLLYKLSFQKFYKRFLQLSSLIVANIAFLWAIDRAFALNLMPF